MVIFDANFLLLLLDPNVGVPQDPATGQPLSRAKERVEHLLAALTEQRETIGIPTPVIAEILVHGGEAGSGWLGFLTDSSRFRVLPFDLRAAVEVASMTGAAVASGPKRGDSSAPWQKVKIDRQIVACGIVERATSIFADDQSVTRLARSAGMGVVSSWELPLPPEDPQISMDV